MGVKCYCGWLWRNGRQYYTPDKTNKKTKRHKNCVAIPVVSYSGLTVWAVEFATQLPLDFVCHPADRVDEKGRVA